MGKSKSTEKASYTDTIEKLIQHSKEKKENASKFIDSSKSKVKDAASLGIDTTQAEKFLKIAVNKLKNAEEMKDYDSAIKYAENANLIITKIYKDHNEAKELIVSTKKMIIKLEKRGVVNLDLRESYKKAEKAFKNNNYEKAITLANKTVKQVKGQRKGIEEASELIASAIAKISEAKSIDADTAEAEKLLSEATSKMDEGDFKATKALARESIMAAEIEKSTQMEDFQQSTSGILDDLQKVIEEADEFGADISKSMDILEVVKAALENNDVKAVQDNVEFCKNSIADAISTHQHSLDLLESAKGIIKEAKESGTKIKEADGNLLKAQ
ncbi:MAG: hypothetical protein JSV49_10405, partial [Thermoplasmata archaeon]